MRVDLNMAKKIADLARLTLSKAELTRYATQMETILEYIEQLQNLDTTNVKPLSHVHEMTNVFQADEVKPSLPREAVFSNAPQEKAGYLIVPKVIKDVNP